VIVFDIETNGLLPEVSRIHLLTIHCDGKVLVYRQNENEDTIQAGLAFLADSVTEGATLAGHNVIGYDIPVIRKLYPWFDVPEDKVFDTMVFARLKHADTSEMDGKLKVQGRLPGKLYGSHSLEAWGYRLGEMKGEYEGDTRIADEKERKARKWEAWNPDMEEYGVQDVVVTRKLLDRLDPASYSQRAIELEHRTQWILQRQVRFGFGFDDAAASDLYGTLTARRAEIQRELVDTVGPSWWGAKTFTPKRDNKKLGYAAGAPLTPIELKDFNPNSRPHIARFLTRRFGWKPTKFTDGGDPQDDEVLSKLDYPEAKLLAESFLLEKRIGQIAEGAQAWLKVAKNGRIHGSVNTNGAVTGRMTHSYPNVAQVPSVKKGKDAAGVEQVLRGAAGGYGFECRACFKSTLGTLVGADASGLELRCLAHYMARWDGGKYADIVVNGDIHTANQQAAGLPTRANAKTFIYAFLYGAGPDKIGTIVGKGRSAGLALKNSFLKKTPALKKLVDAVQQKAKVSKSLIGLDGRVLFVRSAHAALNTLLQSAGAVVMKQALVLLDEALQGTGFKPGVDYEFVANVHDEWQIDCRKEIADEVARLAVSSIRQAGEVLGFRCPLDGDAKVGRTWADTH
jgi:DNA polymerase I